MPLLLNDERWEDYPENVTSCLMVPNARGCFIKHRFRFSFRFFTCNARARCKLSFQDKHEAFSFVNAAVWHQGQEQTKLMEPYLAFVSPGSIQPSYNIAVTSHYSSPNLYDMLWDLGCNLHSAHHSIGVKSEIEKNVEVVSSSFLLSQIWFILW